MATIYLGIITIMGIKSSLIEQMSEDFSTDGDNYKYLNDKFAKESWLDTKWNFYRENLIIDTKDAVPYAEMWAREFNLQQYITLEEGGNAATPPDVDAEIKKKIDPTESDGEKNLSLKQFYVERIDDFIMSSELKKMNLV